MPQLCFALHLDGPRFQVGLERALCETLPVRVDNVNLGEPSGLTQYKAVFYVSVWTGILSVLLKAVQKVNFCSCSLSSKREKRCAS